MRYTGLLLAFATTSAAAQQGVFIDPVEFMVSWPDLVGREVVVTKGRIAVASDRFMVLNVPGGTVTLMPPWKDRDDLRLLFKECTALVTDERCDVAAEGKVGKSVTGAPQLSGVDFYKPAGN